MNEIYRTYAQLASSITPNLRRQIKKSIESEVGQLGEKTAFSEVCEYLEHDFYFGIPTHYVDQHNQFYSAMYLQRNGGRVNKQLFEDGLTVWETGTVLEVPSMEKTKTPLRLWVVAKVLRNEVQDTGKLNLDNSESSSSDEEQTRTTYEVRDPFYEDCTPDAKPITKEPIEDPKLTLVFMAFEKKPEKSGEHLLNVSHLASKFALDSFF